MIYSGQLKKNGLTEKLKHLWKMKETEKQIRFERVSDKQLLIVPIEPSKIAKTTWQYCRPLYEDSWVVFNSYNEVYEFDYTIN